MNIDTFTLTYANLCLDNEKNQTHRECEWGKKSGSTGFCHCNTVNNKAQDRLQCHV